MAGEDALLSVGLQEILKARYKVRRLAQMSVTFNADNFELDLLCMVLHGKNLEPEIKIGLKKHFANSRQSTFVQRKYSHE